MEMSPDISELAKALAAAQAVIEGAVKDKTNPHFRSKYADLSSVWAACRKPLTDNGLSIIQSPGECGDGFMEMATMLLHSSGQWIRHRLTIPISRDDAQGYGSAATYARRYALAAMVSVCPDDDDGNAASAGAGGAPPLARTDWPDGPFRNITSAKSWVRGEFFRSTEACSDEDMLTIYLDSVRAEIAQIKAADDAGLMPGWYHGTANGGGMVRRVEDVRKSLILPAAAE